MSTAQGSAQETAPETSPASEPASALNSDQQAATLLRMVQISKVYRAGEVDVTALQDINLEFHAGEFVVILGASGSGKSTLLHLLGGLDTPTTGEIVYLDHHLTAADERALTQYRREHVGFVFQFYNLVPSLTARENVALVTDIAASPMSADEAMQRVNLGARLDHFPAQLSGGEQQRVAIARAIAKRPDVLLCDEPTGALDYATGKTVLQVLADLNRELGTLLIIITHNAGVAAMADRVIRLSSGRIVSDTRNSRRASVAELSW